MFWWDTDIVLLALLVSFPIIGVLAVCCIGILVLQKLRLQTRLDDSCWWMINYSDITIIREPSVRAPGSCWSMDGQRSMNTVCVSCRETRACLSAQQEVRAAAAALSPTFPTTAMT